VHAQSVLGEAIKLQAKIGDDYAKALGSPGASFFVNEGDLERTRLAHDVVPRMQVINGDEPMAISFPTGEIFVTRALIDPDFPAWAGSDTALKGVFLHELAHVKDGHVLEQWIYADGQAEKNANRFLSILGNLTTVLPIQYHNDYEPGRSFEAGRHYDALVEFAADYAAYELLVSAGENASDYVSYLKTLRDHFKPFELGRGEAGFAARPACFDAMSAPPTSVRSVLIGRFSGNDSTAASVRAPDRKSMAQENPGVPAHVLDVIADSTQRRFNFYVCAVESVFQAKPDTDGTLSVPYFDLSLFERYSAFTEGLTPEEISQLSQSGAHQ
jgi:hypothetical protein